MPMELATSLACVALYDIVIYADDSGSMIFEEGGERVSDLKLILGRVAEVAAGLRCPSQSLQKHDVFIVAKTDEVNSPSAADCCGMI